MIEEKSINTGHGQIYYWLGAGSSEKPTLVFLHGLSSNHTTWDPMVKLFHEKGYSTLAIDLRGHGLSDKTRKRSFYTIEEMRHDLEKIIEAEKLQRYVLVGYSYGAYVSLDFATAHPRACEALVLISANHVSPFDYSPIAFLTPVARWAVNLFGWLLVWQKRRRYYYFDPESARTRGYWRSTFSGYATMPLSINFWMLSEVFALNYRKRISVIQSPVLIIRGENDAFVSDRETADMIQALSRARAVTLGLGHYVASHYQELCAAEIESFLKQ